MATKTAKTATVTARPATTGAIIDNIWAMREEKRRLESEVKEIEAQIKTAQDDLMARMQSEGIEKATGSKASVSISNTVVADVQDWDAFWPYIAKNKFWHLVQKRVSDPAYRELLDLGKKVPGVQPFTKHTVLVRTL
jgi:hypothetical protein